MNSQPENMSSQSAEEIVATSHEPIVEPPQFEGDIQDLLDRATVDAGAPFEQDSLSLLWELREDDPPAFVRLRKRLKGCHIPVSRLDKAIDSFANDAAEAEASIRDAEKAPESEEYDDDPRPWIELVPNEFSAAVDQASTILGSVALNESSPLADRIFTRSGGLVVLRPKQSVSDSLSAASTNGSELEIARIRHTVVIRQILDRYSRWKEETRDGMRNAHPPELVASAILEGRRDFPPLEAVLTAPTIRPDGSLLCEEGYDTRTGLFLHFGGVRFPKIPTAPTREECDRALDVLLEPFHGFPCASDADLAALTSLLITASVRRALEISPFFGIDAPIAGTGKTMLGRCVGILATGTEPALLAPPDREEELHKSVGAALMAGAGVLLIDNVEHPLKSATLCAMLTTPRAKFRILGMSEMADVSTSSVLMVTGNGLTPMGDLAGRCSMIRLDARSEDPTARTFPGSATDEVRMRRPELFCAALTIVIGGMQAALKSASAIRPTRFRDWDRLIRRPLLWLGLEDPASTLLRAQHADPDRERMADLFRAWYSLFGDQYVSAATLVAAESLRELLSAVLSRPLSDPSTRQALGIWLKRKVGSRIDGFVLESRPGRQKEYRISADSCTTSPPCTTSSTPYTQGEKKKEVVVCKEEERDVFFHSLPQSEKPARVVQSPEVVQQEPPPRDETPDPPSDVAPANAPPPPEELAKFAALDSRLDVLPSDGGEHGLDEFPGLAADLKAIAEQSAREGGGA